MRYNLTIKGYKRICQIKIPLAVVFPYLHRLANEIGVKKYLNLLSNLTKRNEDSFHITVVRPKEMADVVIYEYDENFVFYDIELKGIGSVNKDGNIAYFIVAESKGIQQYRRKLHLPPLDLHITIGFDKEDVFGIEKTQVIFNI